MSDIEEPRTTIGLFARRTLRGQCLARFLSLSGHDVHVVPIERMTTGVAELPRQIDVAVVDTAEQACNEANLKAVFTSLSTILPGIPILVVSDRDGRLAVLEALRVGARAYVPSNLDPGILLETIRFIRKGGTFIPLDVLMDVSTGRGIARRAPANGSVQHEHGLTDGEFRVLELLREGQPNKVIARALGIEVGTVKVHVRRILKKLNATNRTEAAVVAQRMV